ncbi:MAG: nodulation protein NfeD [Bacteroides sp.]|nr:nodulation protein NfeD [Bacteroidales bacterium]MBD5250458.1 nodulation protein NfeD [Barnesiella sp.]MBD5253658.1 nodulation protein NfeD [Barnesiella sp.]MBD5344790.1 nodulation protein NfeD [Bacteroides sp.]MBD5368922.1 nodulation protein NfeD [Bacteroides sp.]
MKRFLALFTALLAIISSAAASIPAADPAKVYVLNLDDEIGSTTWLYTRNALDNARAMDADMILVHLNTYGGSVVHADSIRTALLNYPRPVVAFVDNNAASAGALIALACDTVVMRPGATMGAVTVVSGTDGSAMPDKYQSYMRAMMRATAEHHGKYLADDSTMQWRRDPLIAEAMVDSRVSVPGLIDSTRVLTFTTDEALHWGYADGRASSIPEVLQNLGINSYTTTTYAPSWVDRLIGFFTSPGVQAILIMLIIGGIYMEMQTAGMGFPSVVAITAAALYFLPLYLVGIASSWIVVLFIVGLILILLEIFVVPGFGITGISGILCVSAAIIIGLIEHMTFSLGFYDSDSLISSLVIFCAGVVLAIALIWYLTSSYGPRWARRHTELLLTQQVDEGYIGVDMSPKRFIGHTGVAVTDLRPSGKVLVDGQTLDAVATMSFIPAGQKVNIVRYENAQIYVTRTL